MKIKLIKQTEKEKAINLLLEDDFRFICDNDSGREYLSNLLIEGFKGYNNMSLKVLKEELKAREI